MLRTAVACKGLFEQLASSCLRQGVMWHWAELDLV